SAHGADPPPAGGPARSSTPAPRGRPVSVSVAARPAGPVVSADFMGLSFELRSLPAIAGYASRGNLVTLMRSLGPGVMRFGGISADEQAAWVGRGEAGSALPGWAHTAIDESDLSGLAALARATGWRVLLTVNLGHYDPAAAAQEAAAAHALLGSYLVGIEIGNEPDLFPRKHLRPPGAGVTAYLPQAAAYRAAIAAAAPGVPIAGPDPSTGVQGLRWVRAAASTLHPQLLTDHYYPLSSCGEQPTISELLSPTVRRSESEVLQQTMALARAYATPLRMDETNDISCEGQPGVSDTFAAALWALDYTARAMAAGVAGVNFHDLIDRPRAYSPLLAPTLGALAAGALHAAPEWYGLLAAHTLVGGRTLPTSVAGAAPGELSASAVRAPDGRVRLVLVDYDHPGSPPLAVRLRVPRGLAVGRILRLTAPSPAATSGVRLGGREVAPDGTWTPPHALPAVHGRAGSLAVQMDPSSAAVVTLSP
ncbi:MAG: glycosyl hydrolase family 79 C-terminal domain-containing protein, partial [Solirubrobacteraceae bacterium]